MFSSQEVLPGVHHITDNMGVSFTLLAGESDALLVDAGYGLENPNAFASSLVSHAPRLLLTHGHHDHALGAAWFPPALFCGEDLPVFRLRTGEAQRLRVRDQAWAKGLSVPESFLTAPIPDPVPLLFPERWGPFPCQAFDLGGLEVRALWVPGHTPGSVMLLVPRYRLLLTGDNWNPCTWMWFPESLNVFSWRNHMLQLLSLLEEKMGQPVLHVLCSHQPGLRSGEELREYLDFMSEDRIRSAPSVEMGSPIRTRRVADPGRGWELVFDPDKPE